MLRAQGLAEARLAMANAEAESIRLIATALPDGQAAMYMLGLKYLEALPKLAEGKGTTIFLPTEASGVMGALGGMRALLERAGPQQSGESAARQQPQLPAIRPPADPATKE